MWHSTGECIVLLVLTLLVAPLAGRAQPPARVPRVALVLPNTPEADMVGLVPRGRTPRAFLDGLRALGWMEGQNITIERRSAEGRPERYASMIQEIVGWQVDLIVTTGGELIRHAKQATATIPIVMVAAGRPVESGLITSLGHPGGNLTGLTDDAGWDLDGKRLELFKEAIPQSARIAVIGTGNPPWRPETETAARAFGFTLLPVRVDTPEEYEQGFATIAREHPDAVFVGRNARVFHYGHRRVIIDFAARQRLAAMYPWGVCAEEGGLMAYGVNYDDLFRRAATYVDKILKGAKPADLPVEQPTKFELVINLKTAQALGITLPPTLLFQADRVIR